MENLSLIHFSSERHEFSHPYAYATKLGQVVTQAMFEAFGATVQLLIQHGSSDVSIKEIAANAGIRAHVLSVFPAQGGRGPAISIDTKSWPPLPSKISAWNVIRDAMFIRTRVLHVVKLRAILNLFQASS